MRLFPRRDHPSRRLLRSLERRIVAACGLKRAWSRRSRVSLAPRRTDGGTPPLLLIVSGEPGTPGEAAPGVQAYCFRLCLTTAADRLPFHSSPCGPR